MVELLTSASTGSPIHLSCGSGLINFHTMKDRRGLLIYGSPGSGMDYAARKRERIRRLLGASS